MKRLASLLVVALSASPSAAEPRLVTATPADPDKFIETFDDTPAVSGAAIVGLSLGSFARALDVADVRLVAPDPATTALCVRVTSLDGRFSASNLYVVPLKAADGIRLSMVTRKFDREVATYRPDTLAIRSYIGGNGCSPRDALHLPQLQPGGAVDPLIVQVNSSTRRTTAQLEAPDGTIVDAKCAPIKGMAKIAFDTTCSIHRPAGSGAGVHHLAVELDDGFGVERMSVELYLPEAD